MKLKFFEEKRIRRRIFNEKKARINFVKFSFSEPDLKH